MAASKQLGIKEVLNFNVFDYTTGESIFYVDYAGSSSIEMSAERLDLRGGQGNFKLISFDHTKNATMKCSLPLVDLEFIALLTGKDMRVESINIPKREVLLASAGNAITLSATPVTGTLKIYKLSGDRDMGTEQTLGSTSIVNQYTISGQVVSLNATTAPATTKFVCTYDYASPATTRTMTFTADKFPGYFRITGDGIVTDQVDGNSYYTKFDIFKAKPQNNYTITMMSTEATKLEITFDLYAVNVTNVDATEDKVYFEMHELV
jgi:hypothetical protein